MSGSRVFPARHVLYKTNIFWSSIGFSMRGRMHRQLNDSPDAASPKPDPALLLRSRWTPTKGPSLVLCNTISYRVNLEQQRAQPLATSMHTYLLAQCSQGRRGELKLLIRLFRVDGVALCATYLAEHAWRIESVSGSKRLAGSRFDDEDASSCRIECPLVIGER